MVSHHVITLFFVLLATRSIQKTVPSVGWYVYITTEVAKTVVSLLRGFTTIPPRTPLTHLFFFREAPPTN